MILRVIAAIWLCFGSIMGGMRKEEKEILLYSQQITTNTL